MQDKLHLQKKTGIYFVSNSAVEAKTSNDPRQLVKRYTCMKVNHEIVPCNFICHAADNVEAAKCRHLVFHGCIRGRQTGGDNNVTPYT